MDTLTDTEISVGVYGKLPCIGDFFHRGLGPDTINNLHEFHSQCLYALQQQQPNLWRTGFDQQGIWQVYFPKGALATNAFVGVLCPSQDRVGRAFPITALVSIPSYLSSFIFSPPFSECLAKLQTVIAASVHDNTNTDQVFKKLTEALTSLQNWHKTAGAEAAANIAAKKPMDFGEQWPARDAAAIAWMLEHNSEHCVWWNSNEPNQNSKNRFAYFPGIPSIAQYLALVANAQPACSTGQPSPMAAATRKATDNTAQQTERQIDNQVVNQHSLPLGDIYQAAALVAATETYSPSDYDDPLECVQLIGDSNQNSNEAAPVAAEPTLEPDPNSCVQPIGALAQPSAIGPGLTCVSVGFSDIGNVRKKNEDAYFEDSINGLWLVADGIGGLQHGDLASQQVVEYGSRAILSGDIFRRTTQLMEQLQEANQRIYRSSVQQGYRCGSTLVALLYQGGQCSVVWAGDSRLYKYSDNTLEQITADHTNEHNQNYTDSPARHAINRAMGIEPNVKLASSFFSVARGDRLVLCSDGLYGYLEPPTFSELLQVKAQQLCSDELKRNVLATKARDNLTAIIVDVT